VHCIALTRRSDNESAHVCALSLRTRWLSPITAPPYLLLHRHFLFLILQAGACQLALRMLNEMAARKVSPTIYSYAAAISACERSGQWRASLALLDRMQAAGVSERVAFLHLLEMGYTTTAIA